MKVFTGPCFYCFIFWFALCLNIAKIVGHNFVLLFITLFLLIDSFTKSWNKWKLNCFDHGIMKSIFYLILFTYSTTLIGPSHLQMRPNSEIRFQEKFKNWVLPSLSPPLSLPLFRWMQPMLLEMISRILRKVFCPVIIVPGPAFSS